MLYERKGFKYERCNNKKSTKWNGLICWGFSKLGDKVVSLESSINQAEQYGRRNSTLISGIPCYINMTN